MILTNELCHCIYTGSFEVSVLVVPWLYSHIQCLIWYVGITAQYLRNKCEMKARNDDMEIESGEFILVSIISDYTAAVEATRFCASKYIL